MTVLYISLQIIWKIMIPSPCQREKTPTHVFRKRWLNARWGKTVPGYMFPFLIEDAMRRVTARPRNLELGDLCSIVANCAWRFMPSVRLIYLVWSCLILFDLVWFFPGFQKSCKKKHPKSIPEYMIFGLTSAKKTIKHLQQIDQTSTKMVSQSGPKPILESGRFQDP